MILWFDPGRTTGWAILSEGGLFWSGQLDFVKTGEFIEELVTEHRQHLRIGWEMFIVTSGGGRASTPKYSLETIGMLKWLCHKHSVQALPAVPSSFRKVGSDTLLKLLGWYTPGQRHANDAANHLLSWALWKKELPTPLVGKIQESL